MSDIEPNVFVSGGLLRPATREALAARGEAEERLYNWDYLDIARIKRLRIELPVVTYAGMARFFGKQRSSYNADAHRAYSDVFHHMFARHRAATHYNMGPCHCPLCAYVGLEPIPGVDPYLNTFGFLPEALESALAPDPPAYTLDAPRLKPGARAHVPSPIGPSVIREYLDALKA